MRKRLTALAAFIFLVSLSGCIPSLELSERAIVQAIGVDRTQTGYQVTLQIFSPSGNGQEGVEISEQNAKVVSAQGATVASAVQAAALKEGKQIFYGHNRLLVIGREAGTAGVDEILAFFNGRYQSRPNVDVILSDDTAKALLTTDVKQGMLPAEGVQEMLTYHHQNGNTIKTSLMELIEAHYNGLASVAVPIARRAEEGEEKSGVDGNASLQLHRTGIFSGGRLVGELTQSETRGTLWICDQLEKTLLVLPYQGEASGCSVEIYQSHTDTQVKIEAGKPTVSLAIRAAGRINTERLGEPISDMVQLEQLAAEVIRTECKAAFDHGVEYQADIFHFGSRMLQADQQYWQSVRASWPAAMGDIRLQLRVEVDIERIGLEANIK